MTDDERRQSRLKRWLHDWSSMTATSIVVVGAFVAIWDWAGWDFPLVMEKAYAQDQRETHKKLIQLDVEIQGVKAELRLLSTDFLKREQRDMQRDIRDLEVQLAQSAPGEVRRILSDGLIKARQDLNTVTEELRRRGVQ